jgi:hypothetical protein
MGLELETRMAPMPFNLYPYDLVFLNEEINPMKTPVMTAPITTQAIKK